MGSSTIVFTRERFFYAFKIYMYTIKKLNKFILFYFYIYIFHFILHFPSLNLRVEW